MKIRFYSIQDLYDEVKDLPKRFPNLKSIPIKPSITDEKKVVRMQFLERTYSSEYRGGGQKSYLLTTEQILMLSVLKPPLSLGKGTLYHYSQPYFRCSKYELKDKATEIDEKQKALESQVRETFKDWAIKKGVYEIE